MTVLLYVAIALVALNCLLVLGLGRMADRGDRQSASAHGQSRL